MKKEVRFFNRSEKKILCDAIDRLWAHDHIYVRNPMVMEHLVWDNPYREELAGEDNYSFVGMWIDGEIVGLKGIIPQEANVLGKTVKSRAGTIWVVNKQKGLSVDGLDMELFADQIRPPEMIVGIGLSKINMRLRKLSGGYVMENVPRWIVVNRMEETIKYLLPDERWSHALPVVRREPLQSKFCVEVDHLERDEWDIFYSRVVAPKTIGTRRDFKFLHWRYIKSPVLKYHFLTIRNETGQYLGLAVIRIEPVLEGRYSIGRILEFISFDVEASLLLANAIVNYDNSVLIWDFYCFSDVTAFGLEAVGFRKIPEWGDVIMMPTRFHPIDYKCLKLNAALVVSNSIKKKIAKTDFRLWYFTKGDADQDRAN